MTVYLVDFENVRSSGLVGVESLSADDKVVIFYSKNADAITFDVHMLLNKSKAGLDIFMIARGGRNSLDFQLTTYMGYLVKENKYSDIVVISKDKGFLCAKSFWEENSHICKANISICKSIKAYIENDQLKEESPEDDETESIEAELMTGNDDEKNSEKIEEHSITNIKINSEENESKNKDKNNQTAESTNQNKKLKRIKAEKIAKPDKKIKAEKTEKSAKTVKQEQKDKAPKTEELAKQDNSEMVKPAENPVKKTSRGMFKPNKTARAALERHAKIVEARKAEKLLEKQEESNEEKQDKKEKQDKSNGIKKTAVKKQEKNPNGITVEVKKLVEGKCPETDIPVLVDLINKTKDKQDLYKNLVQVMGQDKGRDMYVLVKGKFKNLKKNNA